MKPSLLASRRIQERLTLAGLATPAHAPRRNDAVTVKATDVEVETLKLTEATSGTNPKLIPPQRNQGQNQRDGRDR